MQELIRSGTEYHNYTYQKSLSEVNNTFHPSAKGMANAAVFEGVMLSTEVHDFRTGIYAFGDTLVRRFFRDRSMHEDDSTVYKPLPITKH